jgi:hypothetical protein
MAMMSVGISDTASVEDLRALAVTDSWNIVTALPLSIVIGKSRAMALMGSDARDPTAAHV